MELTSEQINLTLNAASTRQEVQKDLQALYDGEHAILTAGEERSDGSEKTSIVMNLMAYAVDMYVGALTATPFKITSEDELSEEYKKVARANDLEIIDIEHLRCSLAQGASVEVHSFDKDMEDDKKIGVQQFSPIGWSFLYDSGGTLVAAIHKTVMEKNTWHEDGVTDRNRIFLTVYTSDTIYEYEQDEKHKDQWVQIEGSPIQHEYGQVPVFLYSVTQTNSSLITNAIVTQNDAYNQTRTDSHDNVRYDADAILAVAGYKGNQKQIAQQKKDRYMTLDKDGKAWFIEKTSDHNKGLSDLELSRRNLLEMARIPDIFQIVGTTGATSGIALKLAFMPMEQAANSMINFIRAMIRKRIDLVRKVRRVQNKTLGEEYEVGIEFHMPINTIERWQNIGNLSELLSRIDQLKLIPEIDDPEQAYERWLEEKKKEALAIPIPLPLPTTDEGAADIRNAQVNTAVPSMEEAVARAQKLMESKINLPKIEALLRKLQVS